MSLSGVLHTAWTYIIECDKNVDQRTIMQSPLSECIYVMNSTFVHPGVDVLRALCLVNERLTSADASCYKMYLRQSHFLESTLSQTLLIYCINYEHDISYNYSAVVRSHVTVSFLSNAVWRSASPTWTRII